ncbi:MAG: HAD-IIA family hydrolase [Anaerohalosphaeraceae bacterium]
MHPLHQKRAFICDMDGVLYHGSRLLAGAKEFVRWLKEQGKQYLFLTNSSSRTPEELSRKLAGMGIEVSPEHFMTSGIATASFLASQKPGGSAYIIGDNGLRQPLLEQGIRLTEENPDYVVVGETAAYNYAQIEKAVNLVLGGAKLIGTNPDISGPVESGIAPACRALIAPIEIASGRQAYFIGKPNPLIMRHSLKRLACRREETVIIGDRMDTDIIAGIESEIDTVLVLSGITQEKDIPKFPYRPDYILSGVGDIPLL